MRFILAIGLGAFTMTVAALSIADELGRLFFTPEQRVQLDYEYARQAPSDNYANTLTLNGIVQRHGGKRTVWINGVEQQAGRSNDKTPESEPVPLPGQNKSVKLKVGQHVLLGPSANPDIAMPDVQNQDAPKQ